MTDYQKFIYMLNYGRFDKSKQRRLTFEETVDKYLEFMIDNVHEIKAVPEHRELLKIAGTMIKNGDVAPSMRLFWSAGKAAEKSNIAGYNCSYLPIRSTTDMAEMMYILMHGTGVGFSVEKENIEQLPAMPEDITEDKDNVIKFKDSKEGWKKGFEKYLDTVFSGTIPACDFTKIRPKGTPLKTFGGRSSGSEPLENLVNFVADTALKAKGRKLKTIEVFDICCKIAEIVVSGGVRRSACICLSDLDDKSMAKAKHGEFWKENPQRSMANISAVYNELFLHKDIEKKFKKEFENLKSSGTGERGIFSRYNAIQKIKDIRNTKDEDGNDIPFGINPCGEIVLMPYEFCNLAEVIVRPTDNVRTMIHKVQIAVFLAYMQAQLVNFPLLKDNWKDNCLSEQLLGISLTGVQDNKYFTRSSELTQQTLMTLKPVVNSTIDFIRHNISKQGLILPAKPKATTCVKPSGTVSQLAGCSSGIHPAYADYYIRRVRIASTDPLLHVLKESGVNVVPEVGQDEDTATTFVAEFIQKAPSPTSIKRKDVTAIDQLNNYLLFNRYWCDHNVSTTIYVKEDEWDNVYEWILRHLKDVIGLSFLPYSDHLYELAPFEEITEEEYNERIKDFPQIDWDLLHEYEKTDMTYGHQSFACTGDKCMM